jgi:uncharacterized membrane protein
VKRAWWIALLLPGLASATPKNWEVFKAAYNIKDGSKLFTTGCNVCHTEVKFPARNSYGAALEAKSGNAAAITNADLVAVEGDDADGDKFSNGEEIQADFLPGDASSHPKGKPKGVAPAPSPAAVTPESTELIPRHSFHPAVVHFPIALFLFGILLEFWGVRGRPEARVAAKYTLVGGATATLLTIPTGLAVFLRSGFKWEGTPLLHFILAIAATAFMIGVSVWRVKEEPTSKFYWVLLLLTGALVAAAGHFGGVMVYGA